MRSSTRELFFCFKKLYYSCLIEIIIGGERREGRSGEKEEGDAKSREKTGKKRKNKSGDGISIASFISG